MRSDGRVQWFDNAGRQRPMTATVHPGLDGLTIVADALAIVRDGSVELIHPDGAVVPVVADATGPQEGPVLASDGATLVIKSASSLSAYDMRTGAQAWIVTPLEHVDDGALYMAGGRFFVSARTSAGYTLQMLR